MGFKTKRMKHFLDKNYQKIIDDELNPQLKKKFKKYALTLPETKHKIYYPADFVKGNPPQINYLKVNEAFLNKLQVIQKTKTDVFISPKWPTTSLCSLDVYSLTQFRRVYKSVTNNLEKFIKTKQS